MLKNVDGKQVLRIISSSDVIYIQFLPFDPLMQMVKKVIGAQVGTQQFDQKLAKVVDIQNYINAISLGGSKTLNCIPLVARAGHCNPKTH